MKNLFALIIIAIAGAVLLAVINAPNPQPTCGISGCGWKNLTCEYREQAPTCAAVYVVGSFCRQFFSCDSSCQPVPSEQYDICLDCMQRCGRDDYQCDSECINMMVKYCDSDSDCACGVKKDKAFYDPLDYENEKCLFGNVRYVNTSQQCPDFCTGIGGNLAIRCVDHRCIQTSA